MKNNWEIKKLKEVLELHLNAVDIEPTISYKFAGVYCFGKGLFEREELLGANTSYKYFNRLQKDHITISKVKGWEGAIALVDEYYDGMFLSPQYPTFKVIDENETDIVFVKQFLMQEKIWKELLGKSVGIGARRNSISEEKFLNLSIPVPPLNVQQRIVSKIESVKKRLDKALNLKREIIEETKQFEQNSIKEIFEDVILIYGAIKIKNSLIAINENSINPMIEFNDKEFIYIDIGSVEQETSKVIEKKKIIGTEAPSRARKLMKSGNVVFGAVRPNLKKCFVVDEELNGNVCSTGFTIFSFDTEEINPVFLKEQLLSDYFINQCIQVVTGGHYPAINDKSLLQLEIVIPPIKEQEKILSQIENLKTKLYAVKTNHTQTEKELTELMPALLEKAFKGEL